tara:strand:- start:3 stop:164 length:162 start_codon:yes stop_codon:yes gene_type:complete
MRDHEMGMREFGGKHMYRAVINFLRRYYPEILQQWQIKVRDSVEYMEPSRLED